MRRIDAYAYSNRLSRLHPAYKVGCSLLMLMLCLALNRPLTSVLILVLMLALTIGWAGLPWRFTFKLLGAEGGFLLAGVLGGCDQRWRIVGSWWRWAFWIGLRLLVAP